MISKYRVVNCIFGKYIQNNLPLMLGLINYPSDTPQPVRNMSKHYNPKFKKERREKVIKVRLPNFDKKDEAVEQEEFRTHMKELGLFPHKTWKERESFLASTPTIFDAYVPPDGDGKFSAITKEGAKQKIEVFGKKSKSYLSVRKIKSFEDNFSISVFAQEALDIYKKAHEALVAKDEDELIKYVTETAFPLMLHNTTNKTIRWQYLESLEPPRVVHARCTSIIKKENIYAQVTVRFHSQQVLCIYDRFGRLMQGSEILRKDVLEYIVFEKHLANEYGVWRLHGKIIPTWMPPGDEEEITYIRRKEADEPSPIDNVSKIVPETDSTINA